MATPILPSVMRQYVADAALHVQEEQKQIDAFGLNDLLPDVSPTADYQTWHRAFNRGPVTVEGMLEAYRRGRQSALEPKAPPLTGKDYLQQVIRDVAVLRGVSIVDIMGSSRVKHIAHARQEVAWRMRQAKDEHGKPRFSFPQIAHWMGGLDHSTIVHAVKAHEGRVQEADQ